MTAYDALVQVLNVNELVDDIKSVNTDNVANPTLCRITDTLVSYRGLLLDCMENTELNVGQINGCCTIKTADTVKES